MCATRNKEKKLAAIQPNIGVEVAFRQKLYALIDEMHNSLDYWLSAAYRAHTPLAADGAIMANDASPAALLNAIMARLTRRWTKKFNEVAKPLADYFAMEAKDRTDASLRAALKKSGITVEFRITPEIQDIITATVNKNVESIKSIASEHLGDVKQLVMTSVQEGRNLGGLRKGLQQKYGITQRRAELIARTSNNQASAMIDRARAKELGITEAQWVHSSAGKHPRHEHLGWNGKMYNIENGMYSHVSGKYVWPGSDYNCRCTKRMIVRTAHVISEETWSRATITKPRNTKNKNG